MMLTLAHDEAARRGVKAPKGAACEPMRRCLVSGEVLPKRELIRFVAGPDGAVVPDLAAELPGRGLWLSARRDMIHTACARNVFAKAAKAPLRADPDLADQVERLLVRRCVEVLGLARRAGGAVGGFGKVAAKISSGAAGVLLQARDAAEDGRRKLRTAARAKNVDVPIVECLDARELGQAFGERTFVHVALDRGAFARRILVETTRLAGMRGVPANASERS